MGSFVKLHCDASPGDEKVWVSVGASGFTASYYDCCYYYCYYFYYYYYYYYCYIITRWALFEVVGLHPASKALLQAALLSELKHPNIIRRRAAAIYRTASFRGFCNSLNPKP